MTLTIDPVALVDSELAYTPLAPLGPPFAGLRLVEAACRLRNYTRAARECGVSHPAVTAQVQKLESRLGVSLFIRDHSCMRPTNAAIILARAYLEAREILDKAVGGVSRERSPPLVVVASAEFNRFWLAPRLSEALNALSDVAVEFRSAPPDLSGSWDAYIGPEPIASERVVSAALIREGLQAFCSPLLSRTRRLRTPGDLVGAPLLQLRTGDWEAWFSSLEVPDPGPFRGLTFDNAADLVEAAAEGLGVALAPASLVERDFRAGRVIRLFEHEILGDVGFYLCWREASSNLCAIHRLHSWLQDELRFSRFTVGAHEANSRGYATHCTLQS